MDQPTRWMLCLVCALAVLGGGSVDARPDKQGAAVKSLGRIVYLPDVNGQNDHERAPIIYNADNLIDIAKTEKLDNTDQRSMWFENSKQLKQEIARHWGIKGSQREMCYSVEGEFRSLVGSERDVNAAVVHAARVHSRTYIQRGSNLNAVPLRDEFVRDFRRLPAFVENAHEEREWAPFREFMKNWGSHIVDTAFTGAVYQSWSSAKLTNNYRRAQLEARACLKAEGAKGDALDACRRYNEREREDAARLDAHDTRRVRGGSRDLRQRLERDEVTKDLIEKFLKEDQVDEQPVRFEFMPVWEVMLQRSDRGSDDAKRALALQAYYAGWIATGCPLVKITGRKNNNAQMMVPEYSKDKKPTGHYLCIRRCQGCHSNDDCHVEVAQACCRAYGPSALRPDRHDRVVHAENYNSGWCAANNGCRYSVGSGCQCNQSNEEDRCTYRYPLNPSDDQSLKYKIIWEQEGAHPQRHFDSLLAMAM